MADIRSEVMKALPYLSEDVLSQLLMHLYKLGVEEPQDMTFLKESDFECVLKVVQCRKLFNHFQTVFGYNNPQGSSAPVSSTCKPVPENQPFYHINPTSSTVSSSYIDPVKVMPRPAERVHPSYACTNALSRCIQAETKNHLPLPNNTVSSNVTIPPFTISPAFTISEHSSASEEHPNVLRSFVTSNVTSSYVPFTMENNTREPTPITDGFESVSTFQPTCNIKQQADSEFEVSSYRHQSESYGIPAGEQSSSNTEISDESESVFSNHQLPIHKLSAGVQNFLANKKQIKKPFSNELVRVITADLLGKCSNPSVQELSIVAKTAVNAYPESLSGITSGKNSKPGYESLLNMIYNRVNNIKNRGNEKLLDSNEIQRVEPLKPKRLFPSNEIEHIEPLKQKRPFPSNEIEHIEPLKQKGSVLSNVVQLVEPLILKRSFVSNEVQHVEASKQKRPRGRPKGSKRSQSSVPTMSLSESAYEVYQIPLKELPQEVQEYLNHKKYLNESLKRTVIQAVVDDLLKGNNKPNHEALKLVAKSALATYPFSLKSCNDIIKSEIDFFGGLVNEMENRDIPVNAEKSRSDEVGSKSSASLTTNQNGCQKNPKTNLEENKLTPFKRWNLLRNYEVPLEEMPGYIRKDLEDGVPIEEEKRDQFIEVIIHNALQIVPELTRDDLKVIAKAVAKAYPNSLQMRVKNNRFTYLGFLKKLMDIAVNITGDLNLAFSYRVKKCRVPNTVRDDNNSKISKDEMHYFQKLKSQLQTRSKNCEEWSSSIADEMCTTFPLQRLEIKNGALVEELKDSWPFLFHEKGFLLHLRLLFGSCLKKKMEQNFRDKHNTLLNHFVKQSSKQDDIREVLQEMLMSNNVHSNNRRIVLLILDYFEENPKELLFMFQNQKDDMRALPSDPTIIVFENLAFPAENSYSVSMQKTMLVRDVPFTTAFIIYFGTFLVFNLRYPPSISHSLNFVQRCLAEIPVREAIPVSREVSEKVDILLNDIQLVI